MYTLMRDLSQNQSRLYDVMKQLDDRQNQLTNQQQQLVEILKILSEKSNRDRHQTTNILLK